MTSVTNTIKDPAGNLVTGATVRITLITGTTAPGYTSSGEVQGTYSVSTDATGTWTANLTPNTAITPANTYYQVVEGRAVSNINVPATGGPYLLGSILVVPPTTPAALGITGVQVAANGTVAGSRPEVNLVAGSNVTVSAADNPANNRVDLTVNASGGVQIAGDLGGTPSSPQVTGTHLAAPLPIAQGGTGQTTAQAALNALGGATYSRQIHIRADGTASTVTPPVGTWTPTYEALTQFYGWVNVSDGAQNDSISFDFACGAGTYEIDLYHLPFQNRGIYTVQIDGTSVGTIDGYAASLAPARGSITGVTLTTGAHVLTLLMATKNASSSGYIGMVERLLLTRTA